MELNAKNYRNGMLVDDEYLAGISEGAVAADGLNLETPPGYTAFVVRHTTGESIATGTFATLEEALDALRVIPRDWKFERTNGCGSPQCGTDGEAQCGTGTCPKVAAKLCQNRASAEAQSAQKA